MYICFTNTLPFLNNLNPNEMKKKFTFLILLLVSGYAYSQTAITIGASDMPIPGNTFHYDNLIKVITPPAISQNGTWDYGTNTGNDLSTYDYYPEMDTLFSNQGVDVYGIGFKSLTPTLGYNVYYEFDFNANAVEDKMMYVDQQAYGLGAISGNSKDSLKIPLQAWYWGNPRTMVKFPFTNKDSWSSVSYRKMNFTLNVAAAGLNNAPGNHVYYLFKKDTIVGYGKMRLYTDKGPSVYYDVLIDKISQFSVDSFYLNGAPAPALILGAFGISQNQITDVNNRYNFYRKGTYSYLMSVAFGAENFNTPVNIFTNTDGLITTSTTNPETTFSTVLYPNPVNTLQVHMLVKGKDVSQSTYIISDMIGRVVQKGATNYQNGLINFDLDPTLLNGQYIINILDGSNKPIITEQFMLNR